MDFRSLIAIVYEIYPSRIDLPDSLNDGKFYDYALFLPKEETQETMTRLIQGGIEKQFQLTITFETRLMDVYVLTAPNGKGPSMKLSPESSGGVGSSSWLQIERNPDVPDPSKVRVLNHHLRTQPLDMGASMTGISVDTSTMEEFSHTLERSLDRLVIDETHLTGRYSFSVRGDSHTTDEFLQELRNQVGLVLTPDRQDVRILVVRPTSP
jgi:uncharacterized protein (TIGR03435 family)